MRLKEKNLLKKFAATLKKFSAKGAKKVEDSILQIGADVSDVYCTSLVTRWSFFLPKQYQNLDPSYNNRFLGLFWKSKTHILAKFHKTDLVICSDSREREHCLTAK